MKQSPWIALLVLGAAGELAALPAQQDAWGVVASSNGQGASLGRPVPYRPDQEASASQPVPGFTRGLIPVSYQIPAAATPSRSSVIASSAPLPTWPTEENIQASAGTSFASERTRVAPVSLDLPVPASGPALPGPLLPGFGIPGPAGPGNEGPSLLGPDLGPPLPPDVAGPAFVNSMAPDGDWIPPDDGSFAPFGPVVNQGAPRFYVRGEALLWWVKGYSVPPLVTTSNPSDNGILGAPSTQVLFGNSELANTMRTGGRFTAGYWLDGCGNKAIEIGGFFLGTQANNFQVTSNQNPVIARPFFNLNSGQQFSELVAFPGISTGSVVIHAPSNLWGLQSNLVCRACCGCNYQFNWLAGFRYLNLNESLTITENVIGTANAPAPFTLANGTGIDSFATENQFFGGQVGADFRYRLGNRWTLDLRGQLALGDTHQLIRINGSQTIVGPTGGITTGVGNLLALPSNIGSYSRDRFSVVPQLGLNIGYQVNNHLRVFAGYNVLYWSQVVRPGDQIDTTIDVTQVPNSNLTGVLPTGQNRPRVPFKETDLWVQGITLGMEFTY